MKKIILAFLLIVFVSSPTYGFDKWTEEDLVYQLTVSTLLIVDWMQTHEIAKTGLEVNPILGKSPSKSEVDSYFIKSIIAHTAISYILPKPHRRHWQILWIGIESHTTWRNYEVGVRFKF